MAEPEHMPMTAISALIVKIMLAIFVLFLCVKIRN